MIRKRGQIRRGGRECGLTWTDWRLSAYHVSSSTLVFRIRESYPFSLFAKSSVLGLTLTGLTFVLDRDPCIWMEMRLGYGITASTYPIIDLHILTVVILENTHCSEQGPFPVEVKFRGTYYIYKQILEAICMRF
ncbi:Uncharacterized protein HZ326_3367 [Fusarium oxysporum f. sp. albedinis]|nr:Uncharacterized protein HZ326_3367 [Fusarium oxysporum f. sp. albedinis]